ncbi:MAG TPA: trypsin-like peptidase domain-containing protein [Clostridiaceae bacterium]
MNENNDNNVIHDVDYTEATGPIETKVEVVETAVEPIEAKAELSEIPIVAMDKPLGNENSEKEAAITQTAPKGPRKKHRFMSYVATGVISSIVGGTIFTGAAFYLIPNSSLFQSTPLYKALQPKTIYNSTVANDNTSNPSSIISTSTATSGLSVADIVKKVGPAVVGVSTFQGSTLYSEGTGIIFSTDGYIVTNYHVVSGGNKYTVTLSNNKTEAVKIVNYDASLDLAVLKITDSTVVVPGVATFGDSDKLQVGETAVAIGDPLGQQFSNSVTTGVISALNRKIDSSTSGQQNPNSNVQQTPAASDQTYIQTDAAINEGNSGGPLINSQGEVIGINSAKIGGSNVEGLGFAIPINVVKSKVNDLIRPMIMLGISARDIDQATATANNMPVGIYIQDITAFSAAEKAGLKIADVITKFDGTTVKTTAELNTLKAKHKVGDTVKVEVSREGKTVSLNLKLVSSTN